MADKQNEKKTWKDHLTTIIAVTTLLLAACATIASFKAAGYGNRMVLAQNRASDQWAYYQAKSIKETQYQVQRDSLAALMPPETRTEAVVKQIAVFGEEIKRYKKEKNEITQEAQKLEAERDAAGQYNTMFGQALMFLQVGILLSSLSAISKNYGYWSVGVVVGSIGIGFFFYAWLVL